MAGFIGHPEKGNKTSTSFWVAHSQGKENSPLLFITRYSMEDGREISQFEVGSQLKVISRGIGGMSEDGHPLIGFCVLNGTSEASQLLVFDVDEIGGEKVVSKYTWEKGKGNSKGRCTGQLGIARSSMVNKTSSWIVPFDDGFSVASLS